MQATQTNNETINISREKLVSLVSQMFGGASSNPNPDEPHKPGPWDPIIRKVSARMMNVFGPHLEPWRFEPDPSPWMSEFNGRRAFLEFLAARNPKIWEIIGGGPFSSKTAVELNPQPIPPGVAFLAAFAQEAVDRAVLTQEIADAMNQTGERQGIIIVGGRLSDLVDELCGNNFKIKIPIPRPKHDTDEMLSGLELLAAGAVFEQNAAITANEGLQKELRNAGAKLIETGIARV